ncbi:hypothetical protein [Paracidovorax anthurii]|uniref:Uncharacterized protein n=1 Tax=Paracidovorax anthurii TaxID=78229 RepID=A0A328ZK45_9BURK|nr:hypothetical protein [Paracidovorax anthurii]RAR85012.1 hypothetical protein AX018_1008105 [Paracidovorax anthurii]
MNTSRNPSSALVVGQPFHTSTRTVLSQNTDLDTGRRTQVLSTSRLLMGWVGGELCVRCHSSRVEMAGDRAARRGRGAL